MSIKLTGLFPQDINVTAEKLFRGVTDFIRGNPLVSTASVGVGSGIVGAAIGRISKRRKSKPKTKTKRKTKTRKRRTTRKRGRPRKRKTKRRYKYARTAGKRKDTSTRRIRMTKTGQPYVILKSGKARFIKRSSARRSRRLKGGRY